MATKRSTTPEQRRTPGDTSSATWDLEDGLPTDENGNPLPMPNLTAAASDDLLLARKTVFLTLAGRLDLAPHNIAPQIAGQYRAAIDDYEKAMIAAGRITPASGPTPTPDPESRNHDDLRKRREERRTKTASA